MQIVILDAATLTCGDIDFSPFEQLGEVIIYDSTTPEQVIDRLEGKEYVILNKVVLDRDIISRLPSLKYIGLFATGYNNIDLTAAKERGVTVCNAGSYSTDAVAQLVFGFFLQFAASLPQYQSFYFFLR